MCEIKFYCSDSFGNNCNHYHPITAFGGRCAYADRTVALCTCTCVEARKDAMGTILGINK